MFGQISANDRKSDSMFGHTRNQLVHPAPGAEDKRQQMRTCYASSLEKSTLLLEIRKTSGSYVESSAQSFWGERSDKGPSIQHLRPNIQPIYQQAHVPPILHMGTKVPGKVALDGVSPIIALYIG
jgi:hypothetical protein